MNDKKLASCTQAEPNPDYYEMTLTERLDQLESLAQEEVIKAKNTACMEQDRRDLFMDAKYILNDVERLTEAGISFSDALMILTLRELRKRW